MPGQAQPDVMPFLRFRLDNCVCLEPGLSPASVIPAGTSFQLRLDLGFDGTFAPLLIGQTFDVFHHLECIETGAHATVPGGGIAVTLANLNHTTVTSPPIATGPGSNLPIPAGFDAGTYRILTHVHAANPAVRPIVSAFYDGVVIEVV
jgi:hypothetical protein